MASCRPSIDDRPLDPSEAAMRTRFRLGFGKICATLLASGVALPAGLVQAAAPQADAATPVDVTTYHYNGLRTGWNPNETALTQASVASAKFGLLHTLPVDGDVLAQPLLVADFGLPDGSRHDVLVIGTENNSLYAFDAKTYATLWHVNFGTPQSSDDVGCGHVHPQYGVSATPVIVRRDADHASLYVVSATEPQKNVFHTRLHAIDLATGKPLRAPVEIKASTRLSDGSTLSFSAPDQWIRAGMATGSDSIYIAASSHCDNQASKIAGWLIRYDFDLQQTGAFATIDTPAGYQLAAFWATGFAPAIDKDGKVFAVTGNGNFSKGGRDWGESVLRLPPTLAKVEDFFTPGAYRTLNGADLDFGSGGVMLIPVAQGQKAPPMAVAIGKDNVLYLLDRTNLGKLTNDDSGALQHQRRGSRGSGVWGGPAYFKGPAGQLVYVQSDNDVVRAYAVDAGSTPSLTEVAAGTQRTQFGGSLPIVSSNGSQGGSGVLWTIRRHHPPYLEGYDAEHLGAPLFSAQLPEWTGGSPHLTPMVANGRVYIGSSGSVSVFGLAP
jgi:outer membrane protein assembly factor BamB